MPTPTPAPPARPAARVVKTVLKILFFPFLFMVNPKMYLTDGEDAADDPPRKVDP